MTSYVVLPPSDNGHKLNISGSNYCIRGRVLPYLAAQKRGRYNLFYFIWSWLLANQRIATTHAAELAADCYPHRF